MALALSVFILTFVFVISEKVNRAVVSLLGGGLLVLGGVLTQEQAIHGIDFNTLGLLCGMMVIVAITRRSGVFQYLAIRAAKSVDARPWGILVMLSLVTMVLSALLDNVTTVMLVTPVVLLITEELEIPPYPFLFSQIMFSNIGGTATMIGDPPNILIGSMVSDIGFNDFIIHLAPIVPLIGVAVLLPIWLIWGRKMSASDEARQRIMRFNESEALRDRGLLKKSLLVLSLVLVGFAVGHPLHIDPATVAMFGAALLLLLDTLEDNSEKAAEKVHNAFGEVEWVTIFFFLGLFVVVAGIEHAGLLNIVADLITGFSDHAGPVAMLVMWVSAVVSAIVDNIPFVATMIPVIEELLPRLQDGDGVAGQAIWWSLALGACLGGNGSLIGASANLIVAGYAERGGHPISFLKFAKHAFPLMLMSVGIACGYVYLRYLAN